nr:hypothetical protein [Tawny frogmouth aviadenovirus A]
MEDLVEQLFVEGVAYESQWKFPSKTLLSQQDRELILKQLQRRFSSEVALLHQLPAEDRDSLRAAFYSLRENWFHQLFQQEGYNGDVVARSIKRWLAGDINTLVLCGGRLSHAKLLYNTLLACFPTAVSDSYINCYHSMELAAEHASLYALPFVEQPPEPIMLHLMEGNPAVCCVDRRLVRIKAMPILIHCLDLNIVPRFVCRNTCVLFLTGDPLLTPACHAPRLELRDFVQAVSCPDVCTMSLHCTREHPLCTVCNQSLNKDNQ